jgi:APA family basic amino acid/polyamine antiporter
MATNSFFKKLITIKPLEQLNAQAETSELKRSLTAFDLTMMGIGGIIGTGIFVLTGTAAYEFAGPAVVISFVVSGIAAATAAMAYAEMSSMIPIAGSAYTYAYATMGELVGLIIGWDLILEYLVGAATVAVGWSGYLMSLIYGIAGTSGPSATLARFTESALDYNTTSEQFIVVGAGGINVPAAFITLFCTLLLIIGIKESARVNSFIVIIKVIVVLLFIFALIPKINPANYTPFFPANQGKFSKFGVTGMLTGATTVFFAYIGFDAVSTTAQETRNPQRDLPIGIIGSLAICTVLYIAVSLVATGVLNYTKLDGSHPLSKVAASAGLAWLEVTIDIGAICGLTSVMLITLMGQPRIFYSMAEDGLFPQWATKIHPRFKTPWVTTLITGIVCAICAGVLPINVLGEMTSIGTLFAFVLVNIGVIILRFKRPDAPRKFKIPLGIVFPVFGVILNGLLVCTATVPSIIRLFVWMAIGLAIYFLYGRRNSKLNNPEKWASYGDNKNMQSFAA